MIGLIIKTSKSNKLKRFEKILESSNDQLLIIDKEDIHSINFDFLLQNGMKKPSRNNNDIYELMASFNKPILIREAPVLRQIGNGSQTKVPFDSQWSRFSWNSFFMDEGLFPYDSSYDRWYELSKKFDINVYDWKRRGDAILFNLQIPTDSALNRLTYNNIDYKDYILEKIKQTQAITDRPIIVRSHPFDETAQQHIESRIEGIEFSQDRTLYEDLDRAWCMVTYNSTSCVESTLYGTPTIVLDSSAISTEVSQTKLEQIEESWQPDREEWCKKIAFHQWQGCELSDGYVWNLLKKLVWN